MKKTASCKKHFYAKAASNLNFRIHRCWIEESNYTWILTVPVLILLFCSAIFLINIVRVLITKLHPKSHNPAPLAVKKAVRATLILVGNSFEIVEEMYHLYAS